MRSVYKLSNHSVRLAEPLTATKSYRAFLMITLHVSSVQSTERTFVLVPGGGGGGVLQISSDGDDRISGGKNQNPKKSLDQANRCQTSFVVLYSQSYTAGMRGHYHKSSDYLNAQKNPYLNQSSHPKKYLPNFHTQKILESKISNPKKYFDHPHHLKSGVPPPPPGF